MISYSEWVSQTEESKEYPEFVNKDIRLARVKALANEAESENKDLATEIVRLNAIITNDDKTIHNLSSDLLEAKRAYKILSEERERLRLANVNMRLSIAAAPPYKVRVYLTEDQKARVLKLATDSNYATVDEETRKSIEDFHMSETKASRATIRKILKGLR